MSLKKNILLLGCLSAVALGLIAALLVLRSQQAPPVSPSSEGEAAVLVYQTRGAVSSLRITLDQAGSYTLSGLSFEGDRVREAALSQYDEQLVNQSRIAGVLNASRSLYALELLFESPADDRPFGLAQPRAVAEVADETGYTVTLLIGDSSPGNEGIYLKRQDSPAIYLVPAYSLENYLLGETAYLNRNITPGSPKEGFDTLILGGTVREKQGQVVIRREGEAYLLTAPVQRPLEESMGLALLSTLPGLDADSVAAINPTREDLRALGLDHPYATAEASGSWGEFYLSVTAPDPGGMVYLYREGVPLLYTVRASLLPWLELPFTELMDPFACTPDIDRLEEVSLLSPSGEPYRFQLSRGEKEELSVTLGGKEIDAENFLRFYVTLISARLAEYTDELPASGQPDFVITYTERSGESQPVEFYAGPARRHFIRVGDEPFFLTPSTYLDRVREDLEKIAAGQPVESYSA